MSMNKDNDPFNDLWWENMDVNQLELELEEDWPLSSPNAALAPPSCSLTAGGGHFEGYLDSVALLNNALSLSLNDPGIDFQEFWDCMEAIESLEVMDDPPASLSDRMNILSAYGMPVVSDHSRLYSSEGSNDDRQVLRDNYSSFADDITENSMSVVSDHGQQSFIPRSIEFSFESESKDTGVLLSFASEDDFSVETASTDAEWSPTKVPRTATSTALLIKDYFAMKESTGSLEAIDETASTENRRCKGEKLPAGSKNYFQVTEKDVKCGRGPSYYKHPGNLKLKAMKDQVQEEYLSQPKAHKKAISQRLVDQIHKSGGKFLRKEEGTDLWCEVSRDKAREKVAQALREDYTPEKRKAKRMRYRK